jgi:ferredoxin
MYRLEVDRSLCSGFGSCVELVPGVFRLAEDGLAEALGAESAEAGVVEAAVSCPMGAIRVVDADTGEEVVP